MWPRRRAAGQDNVSLEGVLSAPALPARCLGLRRRRETARQRRAGSERRRGGEAAHTPDRPSLGPPRSPASLRQARRTGRHGQCTVAPLKLHVGATPARCPQSIRGRPPAAEAAATPSEAAATPAIWHSGALVGACLFKHRRGKAWACGLRCSPPHATQTLARSSVRCQPLHSLGAPEKRKCSKCFFLTSTVCRLCSWHRCCHCCTLRRTSTLFKLAVLC